MGTLLCLEGNSSRAMGDFCLHRSPSSPGRTGEHRALMRITSWSATQPACSPPLHQLLPFQQPSLPVCPSVCLPARPAALRGHIPLCAGRALGPALRPLLCTHVTLTPPLLLCARLNCPSQLAVISDSVQISQRSVSVPPGNPQGRAGVLHASCLALAAAAARQINDKPCEGLA